MAGEQSPEQRARDLLAGDPAARHLGVEIVAASEAGTTIRFRPQPEHRNGLGLLHGGYVFMLADTAFAYCVAAAGATAVTHHADITYMSPIRGESVEAEARISHRYGKHVICDVEVRDADGSVRARLIAHGVTVREPGGEAKRPAGPALR